MPTYNYGTSDPRKITSQTRQMIADRGEDLLDQSQDWLNKNAFTGYNTEQHLNELYNPMAYGQGGYNADETSQIKLTPQQQQQMVTSAGISAGTGTAAAVGAAQRAAAAAGGNPAALAAYRARAAQTTGQQAGDAMTKARVDTSNAAAGRAQTLGQARLGQQTEALGYMKGLQGQKTEGVENALNRRAQLYGTQSGNMNQAASTGVGASQTPTQFDKIIGGISSAVPFLEEGDVSTRRTPAVVGENGPEKIVDIAPEAGGYPHLDAGGYGFIDPHADNFPIAETDAAPAAPMPASPNQPAAPQTWWQKMKHAVMPGEDKSKAAPQQNQPTAPTPSTWSPVDTYKALGAGAGFLIKHLEDGDIATAGPSLMQMAEGAENIPYRSIPSGGPRSRLPGLQGENGIFTEPTRVNLQPNEAVVPLTYRAGAKVRPSMAALPAARQPGGTTHALR